MAKIIFKDGKWKIVSRKQLNFILGIKNVKKQVFTYEFI